MSTNYVKAEDLEKKIEQKLKSVQQTHSAEDLRKKAMTLKVRANRQNYESGNNFWETAEEEKENEKADAMLKAEFDSMRMEMVREMRDMKNGLQKSMSEMQSVMSGVGV